MDFRRGDAGPERIACARHRPFRTGTGRPRGERHRLAAERSPVKQLRRSAVFLSPYAAANTMPVFFGSNALYPVDLMPSRLKVLSHVNPLNYQVASALLGRLAR